MTAATGAAGASLKKLRTDSNVSQPLVAAMAGTSTLYLAKVEDGLLAPSNSYVAKVTQAIVRLMQDPPRPCPVLGCDGSEHLHRLDGVGGDPKSHHADFTASGEDWKLEVRRHDDQDTEWVVYVAIDDGYALTPASFLAVTDAYKRASAFAATLNGRGADLTR